MYTLSTEEEEEVMRGGERVYTTFVVLLSHLWLFFDKRVVPALSVEPHIHAYVARPTRVVAAIYKGAKIMWRKWRTRERGKWFKVLKLFLMGKSEVGREFLCFSVTYNFLFDA